MMWIDNIELIFEEKALKEIAHIAFEKKIGARGLRGVIDKVLTDIMFENGGFHEEKITLIVTKDMVDKYVGQNLKENKTD